MAPAVLYPHYDHPALEERYASWQTQMLLRRDAPQFHFYLSGESASSAVHGIDSEFVLVVTDPLMLPAPGLAERLQQAYKPEAFAAVPVANETLNPKQKATLPPYMTLRELQLEMETLQKSGQPTEVVTWDKSDPGAFLCPTKSLAGVREKMRHAIDSRQVVLSRNDFIHRWSSLRGKTRTDLLARISPEATTVLEIGCGEGPLGEALKRRQKCRVVGIEVDKHAAAVARKRIDDVYCGDVREIISIIVEKFDWIVGGDIVEHIDEPWSFLGELRRLAAPGGRLLLSIPNIANGSVIADLLQGRFDYVYMGLTCVGHLRFFTRRSIGEMLAIAGWEVGEMEPHELTTPRERDELIRRLKESGVTFSADDLLASGYYVIARNPA